MRDINHLPRVTRYYMSNSNGLLNGTFCTAVTNPILYNHYLGLCASPSVGSDRNDSSRELTLFLLKS
jgi:hypothetical protein